MMRSAFIILAFAFLVLSCRENTFSPKPRAYPKVVYPEKSYQAFEDNNCGFTFEFPTYAFIQQDTSFSKERTVDGCWFDIFFPSFDSRLHCSYFPVGTSKTLEELKTDAFELMDWHKKKANYIEEILLENPAKNVSGFAFDIKGPAASPYQFFLTDNKEHFFRAALYFNTQVKVDSLAPVYNFLKKDIDRMIESFEWE